MSFRILPLLLFCLLCFTRSIGQVHQNIYYLKNSGELSNPPADADFVRIISEPDSGSILYNVKEFYRNDKPKLSGKTTSPDRLILEGLCTRFYPSGIRQEVANYVNGVINGDVFEYYPNGKLYSYINYTPKSTQNTYLPERDSLIQTCNDSTGKTLVADGNGYYISYTNSFKDVFEEGPVRLGLKDKSWKGATGEENDKLTFTETYDNGKLIDGESIDKNGRIYKYSNRGIPPEYIGGINSFYTLLGNNIKYPKDSKNKGIQGRVIAQFKIDTDGSLIDINIIKTPSPDIGAETLRVLQLSPKWTPGILFGRVSKTQFTIPLNFGLSDK